MAQCGIGSIVNKSNGKLYIFKSKDLTKTWENYHALLNSNFHHNKELQNDWNELGHSSFVFEIKEITEDNEEILNQKLNEHLENTNDVYDDIDLDSVPLNYKTKILLDELYYIIGETQINPIFLNKLSINNIDQNYYLQIKEDAEKSIKNGEVKIGEVDQLLDKLINEIVENQEEELKNKKENSLKELYKLTGKTKIIKKYKELLEKNGLSEETGLEIKREIVDLINDDRLDVSVKEKFDQLIEEEKQIHDKKIEKELISQLHELTGEMDLSEEYVKKLQDIGLAPEIGFMIRQDIKNQIQDGKFRDEPIEKVLNDALDEECEKIAVEKENNLIKHLHNLTGENDKLSSDFESKLDVFNLDYEKGHFIKKEIYDLIKSREISEESQIDLKIDELIEIEVVKETKIKKELFNQLHDIIGEEQLNDEFKSKLKSNNIDEEWGISLLNSLENDITNHVITEGFDFKTYIDAEIINKKQSDDNLLSELYKLTGKDKLSKKYLILLDEKGLTEETGLNIKNKIIELIKSDNLDVSVKEKFDQLIEEEKRIIDKKVEEELLSQLHELTGELDLSEEYVKKLQDNDLTPEIGFMIRQDIKNQIQDGKFRDEPIEKVLNDAIHEEYEKVAVEKENKLIDYLYGLTGENNNLSSEFRSKLDVFDIEYSKGRIIKQNIYDLIKSREITEESQIDLKIDELIEIEVIKKTKIKEELFNQLHEIVGEKQLNDEFKTKLESYNLSEEWGISLLNSLENDITANKISKGFDFKARIDKLIINEKEKELTNQLNEVYEDKMFKSKLNKNFLNDVDAKQIKSELMKIINSKDIDAMVALENKTIDKEVNDRITERHEKIKDKVIDIRENLLGELYTVINKEYTPKINSGTIREDFVEKIKNYLEDVIKQNHIIDSKFDYKIDELNDLNNKSVKYVFNALFDEEKRKEEEEIDNLRKIIKNDLSVFFKNVSTSFINIKLKEYDLPPRYASKTKDKLIRIIDSNTVHNKKFKFKIDELKYYKANSVKEEINNILKEFKEEMDQKLNQLYAITGKDTLNSSFKNLLSNKGLNEKAGWKVVNEFKEDILNEKPITNLQAKINNRLNQMEIDKNDAYELLENKVGPDANKMFFTARLMKRNLEVDIHGRNIKQNIETLIQSGEVNSKNFDDILDKQLDNQVTEKNNRLKQQVDDIIGLNSVNQSFLTDISQYNLTENDAITIRSAVLNSIENNKLKENAAKDEINRLIANRGKIRTTELSINKVHAIIGENSINSEFSERLTFHDLTNSDGIEIRDSAIQQIKKGNLNLEDIEDYIENSLESLDKENVKKELNNLSGDSINDIMKKHSISGLLPLKIAKISKLMDNVPLMDLKTDLAECGVVKYKIKYGSGFSSGTINDDDHNFCANCGAKLDKGSIFCSSCGTKVE